MTISTTTSRISYNGNGATTVFSFPYRFLANGDLVVLSVSAAGVETTKTLTTDYTLTGAGDDAGGSVTMLVAPSVGTRLIIYRDTDITQETDYISGDPFPAETHERALDRLTMIAQEIGSDADRAIKVPVGDSSSLNTTLPASANRLDKFLVFDATTGEVELSTVTQTQVASAVAAAYAAGSTADAVTFLQEGTGAVSRTVQAKLREWVTPEDFGAVGDGSTNDTAAIQLALDASNRVRFSSGKTYLMNSGVTKTADKIEIDFGNAKFLNGGAGFLFSFGTRSDTSTSTGLTLRGGFFEQVTPGTTSNWNYIKVAATKDFSIRDVNMKNVSNGGIYIEAGCEDGVIDGCNVDGMSGYTTNRGIWLAGDTASDYTSQLIDISTIARNATALPVYAVKNVNVTNCTVKLPFYGIYLMNTRDCHVENNFVDISGGGGRCIALNNYSPGAVVKGNTLRGDQSATGVLITQFSSDVLIEGNTFLGSFGGGRDIYVAYLADAMISNNRFSTDSTQQIQFDMGGTGVVRGNYFTRPSGYSANTRAVRVDTIDSSVAGTSTYGNTATTLSGIVFDNNIVKVRNCGVYVNTPTAANGNIPGLDVIHVRNNIFYNMDTAAGADEFGLRMYANGSTYVVKYTYGNNCVYPEAFGLKNRPSTSGTGFTEVRNEQQFASFRIANAAGGGAVTVTKLWGGNMSCAAARSGDSMLITPRTIAGATGSSVGIPVSVVDALGTALKYDIQLSGSQYLIRVFDSAGAQILLSTTAATIDVLFTHATT